MSESALVRSILLAYGTHPRIRLFRNNVGVATGLNGGVVTYGLCTGSADIIGISSPEGRFIALEAKSPGKRPTPEQMAFLNMVDRMGGIAGVVYSLKDVALLIGYPPGLPPTSSVLRSPA